MAMLDILAKGTPRDELVVATFDHGTRETSGKDAEFVSEVASALQLKFYRGEGRLGGGISEERAREKRYDFLRKIAFREKGEIWTAHHLDDLVESVAINFIRGTGIRGLAPMAGFGIRRPLIDGFLGEVFDRRVILKYASENGVRFRQDPTNSSDKYLRNRVREKVFDLPRETKMEIYRLWKDQKRIVREIDEIVEDILPEDLEFEREFYHKYDKKTSLEIIRGALIRAGIPATRPRMEDFLDAILNYQSGKQFNLPRNRLVKIGKDKFRLEAE